MKWNKLRMLWDSSARSRGRVFCENVVRPGTATPDKNFLMDVDPTKLNKVLILKLVSTRCLLSHRHPVHAPLALMLPLP